MRNRATLAVLVSSVALAGGACGPRVVADPSVGEVLVVVDTDAPVPQAVARLRVDLYDDAGRWYATREVERSRASDWPASFGLNVTDAEGERSVLVRLRAFADGGVRDYRGERFAPKPPRRTTAEALRVPEPPAATGQPRLLDDGADVTPAREPAPLLTIDRLVRVRVRTGARLAARVTLRGACFGTMADLAGARTCTDAEGELAPVLEASLEEDRALRPSLVGTWGATVPCGGAPRAATRAPDGSPRFDDEACAPGGAFRFGTPDGVLGQTPALPERIVLLSPFYVDRWEMTVGRYRSALAAGFQSPDDTPVPAGGAGTQVPVADPERCSWTAAPAGNEALALTCVSARAARALCNFFGGDLPTEAQWEYVAAVAGRERRSRFPWDGPDDAVPSCKRAIWGRSGDPTDATFSCRPDVGPARVDARVGPGGDVTPELGVVGLGGNVYEWTRDAFAPLDATCWAAAPLRDPTCDVPSADARSIRGGAWFDDTAGLVIGQRRLGPGPGSGAGFRCVRAATEAR